MSGVNFFSWIRDGVRQSVLLGVSDAIEHLGAPAATEELHPSVQGFLKVDTPIASRNALPNNTTGPKGNRKRLGRSLKDMGSSTAAND